MRESTHQLAELYQLPILDNMARKILLFILFLFLSIVIICQEKPKINLPVLPQENLEYQALKQSFFLVSQEYIIYSKEGTPRYRYGKNYFGRTFAIGILSHDGKIWFPKYVRFPWVSDPNFKEYRHAYTPRLSGLRFRAIEDTTYRKNLNIEEAPKDTTKVEMFLLSDDTTGIRFSDDLISKGTLFVFYTSNTVPEKRGDISYVIISAEELNWDSDGVSYIKDPYAASEKILGGALYQRIITPGKIEWRLAGFFTQIDGKWAIKSVKML